MRSFVALCFILALSVSVSNAFTCLPLIVNDTTIYDICDLRDTVSTIKNVYYLNNNTNPEDVTLTVSLGENVANCGEKLPKTVLATFQPNSDDRCDPIVYVEPLISLYDTDDLEGGLTLTYPYNADNINGTNYTIIANLICNKDGNSAKTFNGAVYNETAKTFTLNVTSSNSCSNKNLSKLAYFMTKYQAIFTTLFIIIGLVICFFGLNLLKYTIFTIAAVGTTLISGSLFLNLIDYNSKGITFWLIFAVCVLIGCVVGWIAVKIETLGFIVLGTVLGVIGGQFLFAAILANAGAKVAVYWVTIVLCGIIGAGLAYKFWKSFVIIATSIIGSFLVVKSIGGAIGNFPSVESMAQGFEFTGIIYAYLAGIAVLAVAGMYVQHKRKKADEEKETDDVHGYQRVMAGYEA